MMQEYDDCDYIEAEVTCRVAVFRLDSQFMHARERTRSKPHPQKESNRYMKKRQIKEYDLTQTFSLYD
jgi:hypothetical protein